MKFPFGSVKKSADSSNSSSPVIDAKKPEVKNDPLAKKALTKASAGVPNGKRLIIVGTALMVVSFLGVFFIFYLNVNAQNAKEAQLKTLREKLVLVSTEKEVANHKAEILQNEVGKVIDLEKVVATSQKINGDKEAERKTGSLWIDRKTSRYMVSLGVLNGVTKGSQLIAYDGEEKFATLRVISTLDVVSYVEPVDKKIVDFLKDYYSVRIE